MRKTIQDLNIMKDKKDKIIALTSYDYQTASILDEICDLILVGDSLGNVFQGKETTLSVTLDEIIYHAKAVDKAIANAHFCVDMPFMTYQKSTSSALENIGKVFKETNAQSVKIEMNPDLMLGSVPNHIILMVVIKSKVKQKMKEIIFMNWRLNLTKMVHLYWLSKECPRF